MTITPLVLTEELQPCIEMYGSAPSWSVSQIEDRTQSWCLHTLGLSILWDHNEKEHQERLEKQLPHKRYKSYVQEKQRSACVNPWQRWIPVGALRGKPEPIEEGTWEENASSLRSMLIALHVARTLAPERLHGNVLGAIWKKGPDLQELLKTQELEVQREQLQKASTQSLWEGALEGLTEEQRRYYQEVLNGYGSGFGQSVPCAVEEAGLRMVGPLENFVSAYPIFELPDPEWKMLMEMSCPLLVPKWLYEDGSELWYVEDKYPRIARQEEAVPHSVERSLRRLFNTISGVYWLSAVDSTPLRASERLLNSVIRKPLGERKNLMEQVTTDVYFGQSGLFIQDQKKEGVALAQLLYEVQGMHTRKQKAMFAVSGVVGGSSLLNAFSGLAGLHVKALMGTVVSPAILMVAVPYMGYQLLQREKMPVSAVHEKIGQYLEQVYGVKLCEPFVRSMQHFNQLTRNQDTYGFLSKNKVQGLLGKKWDILTNCPAPNALTKWFLNMQGTSYAQGCKDLAKESGSAKEWSQKNEGSLSALFVIGQVLAQQLQCAQGNGTGGVFGSTLNEAWLYKITRVLKEGDWKTEEQEKFFDGLYEKVEQALGRAPKDRDPSKVLSRMVWLELQALHYETGVLEAYTRKENLRAASRKRL